MSASASWLASREVAELSLVRTLLRSVLAVPGADEAVSWDLKLERSSSPPTHGAAPPIAGADPELSILLLYPKCGRVADTGGGPAFLIRYPPLRKSGNSPFVGDMPGAQVEEETLEEIEGRLGGGKGLGRALWNISGPSSEGVGSRGGRERLGVSETGCRTLALRGREKFSMPLGSWE